MSDIKLRQMPKPDETARIIEDFIVKETLKHDKRGGVMGLSSGVDSNSVACAAATGYSRYNSTNPKRRLKLHCFSLPTGLNTDEDEEVAFEVYSQLKERYPDAVGDWRVINIQRTVDASEEDLADAGIPELNRFNRGNMISRLRADKLHTLAAYYGCTVIGTGNRDEDFTLGYYTLLGDGAVFMSPIGDLPKRLVRELLRYYGFAKYADRTATAGLEPNQTDFRDLGYSYLFAETVTEAVLQGMKTDQIRFAVNEIGVRDYTKYKETFGKSKFYDISSMVSDVLARMKKAETKAEFIRPVICKLDLPYG